MAHLTQIPRPRQRADNNRGGVAILSAVFMLVGVAVAAFAVDLGALHLERRTMQGAADLAAIAAARDIAHAEAAARATLKANGFNGVSSLAVERGAYAPDAALTAERRFVAGKAPHNAVRLTVEKQAVLHFAKALISKPPMLRVSATATSSAVAAFSIGSRLAAVREGVINQLLSGLLGGNVALSVMDYNAPVSADIDMFDFLNALATKVNVRTGTYDDVLQASGSVGDVLAAAASVSERNGNSAAKAALEKLGRESNAANLTVPLSTLIDLGPLASLGIGDPTQGLDTKFKVMDLVTGAATIANGEHQVALDLASGIPGLLSLKLEVAIGEPAQSSTCAAVGDVGAKVRTAQTRLKLIAEVGGSGLLLGVKVRLPIFIDVAYAEGRLASISCAGDGSGAVDVAARPGVAEVWIGDVSTEAMSNFSGPPAVATGAIVSAPLIKITGGAHINVASTSETTLSFSQADIDGGVIKRVASTNLTQSLVTSLVRDLTLNVKVLGLGLGLPSLLTATVAAVLAPIAAPLDAIVDSLLKTLGVRLGEADVKVHGVRCGSSVLAG